MDLRAACSELYTKENKQTVHSSLIIYTVAAIVNRPRARTGFLTLGGRVEESRLGSGVLNPSSSASDPGPRSSDPPVTGFGTIERKATTEI